MSVLFLSSENLYNLPESFYMAWRELAACTGQADPVCCTPEWQLAWHNVSERDTPAILAIGNDSIAQFSIKFPEPNRIIITPLECNWLFGQPLLGYGAVDLLDEVIHEIRTRYNPGELLVLLSGIQANSFFAHRIFGKYHRIHSLFYNEKIAEGCASLINGLEGWLGRRSANHRAKLKKARRIANDMGIYFERYAPATEKEAEEIFSIMLNIEEKSWKGRNNCGMNQKMPSAFYLDFMKRQTRGKTARIILARLGKQQIGYIFGSVLKEFYRGQQFSFDQDFAQYSIGNILQYEKIAWLCEEGIKRYDMGPVTGPRMEYKLHWTEEHTPLESWVMKIKCR